MTDWSDVEFFAAPLKARKSKDFLPILATILMVWDILACALAGTAALYFYYRYIVHSFFDLQNFGPFQRDIAFGSVITALILRASSSDLDPRSRSIRQLIWLAERKCLISFTLLIAVGSMTRATDELARLWLILWMSIFSVAIGSTRYAVGRYLHHLEHHGEFREAVAIIGAAGMRERMASQISEEADVVGIFSVTSSEDELDEDDEDDLKQLFDIGREGGLDAVILALESDSHDDWKPTIERLKELPVQVAICPDKGWARGAKLQVRMLGGMPMTVIADKPLKQWDMFMKTALDKFGALFLLIVLAPLMLAIAIAVATTSPGPVIFQQTRRGWCGAAFIILKFRTMHSTEPAHRIQTRRNDPRCTSVGRFLRRSSLDELPQLWNVLCGDMSLVGPRPHADALHDFDHAGSEIISEYAQRHRVKPGLTGWAQVNGARGATVSSVQLRRRVELDLYYIENWSLFLDLEILLRTPFAMIGEGAF